MILALYLRDRNREERSWEEISAAAHPVLTAADSCVEPPPETGLAAGFCRADFADMQRAIFVDLDLNSASPALEEWLRHVLDHGWSDAVALVAGVLCHERSPDWAREAADRILLNPEEVRAVYAREAMARREEGLITSKRLAIAWIEIEDDFESFVARYGWSDPQRNFHFSRGLNLYAAIRRDEVGG